MADAVRLFRTAATDANAAGLPVLTGKRDDAQVRHGLRAAGYAGEKAFENLPYYPLGLYSNPTAYCNDLTGVLNAGPLFWNVRRN